ncbi:InlB B-repeat-containing protein [Chiayiivirga flava]|uniref:DUF11 domain-containing protein n=1 Tax=Chiayiivirga flava TaxID=659595 RepID=A0A7W8D2V2_9GAMM|nr:DUF11 domain-containing protein [Chiayiivirga flava]MBB5206869.1 hypothetical protein [Chiayiivirga flava]
MRNPDASGSGAEYDRLGTALAIDGDTAFIASTGAYSHGTRGAVLVLQRSGGIWSETARLLPDPSDDVESFGQAIAVSGDTVVVSAPDAATAAGPDRGAVYVFVRDGAAWRRQARIDGGPGEFNAGFGSAVAVDGDVLLVGAPSTRVESIVSGAVIEFRRNGESWSQTALLPPGLPGPNQRFGASIVLDGSLAAIGAPGFRDPDGQPRGGVFVFANDGAQWQHTQRLVGPGSTGLIGDRLSWNGETLLASELEEEGFLSFRRNGTNFDPGLFVPKPTSVHSFCNARLAHTATLALVGCPADTDGGIGSGSALLYTRSGDTWVLRERLRADVPSSSSMFGRAVALSGDAALIAAPSAFGPAGTESGIVHAYAVDAADAFSPSTQIDSGTGPANDFFARSVAIDGNTAVVGVELDDTSDAPNAGAAYVFVHDGAVWTLEARLQAPAGTRGAWFGSDVAVDGDTLVVGERARGTLAGAAYVYRRNNGVWSLQQTLRATPVGAYEMFGTSVALQADRVVIGAPGVASTPFGRAYVFERVADVWQQQAVLRASDETSANRFGSDVALDGETVLVGALLADSPGMADTGAAYVFERDDGQWPQRARLAANDAKAGDLLGSGVALRGDEALLGALSAGPVGQRSGAGYLFRRSGGVWVQQQRLSVASAPDGASVGRDVALGPHLLALGATRDPYSEQTPPGAVYLFGRDGEAFAPIGTLQPTDSRVRDGYGNAVALDGQTLLIGAPGSASADGTYPRAGAAWLHRLPVRVTIVANGSETVHWADHGTVATFDLTPPEGQSIVQADGCSGTLIDTAFTTAPLLADCTIMVTFASDTYTVSYVAGANGALLGDTQQTVPHGGDGTPVQAVADAHHHFAGWSDGSQENPRTERDVRAPLAVAASFANAPPQIQAVTHTPEAVYERSVVGVHVAATDEESPDLAYRFDCDGDGMFDAGPQPAPEHDCATDTPGTQTIVVQVSDGASGIATGSVAVTVLDARPAMTVSLAEDAVEDLPLSLAVAAQSPSAGDVVVRVEVDCDHDGEFDATLEATQPGTLACPARVAGGSVVVAARATDDEGELSDIATLSVDVADINDAPTLTLATLPPFAAGSSGAQTIPAFARFDAGPDDEDASQQVDDYLLDVATDPEGVLGEGHVDIGDDGSLVLTLSGRSGTASVLARVRDSGPAGGKHVNVSAPVEFVVTVPPGADLQSAIDNGVSHVFDGDAVTYHVIVANAGPSDASDVQLVVMQPAALRDFLWHCRTDISTATCPPDASGAGSLEIDAALPDGSFLRFDIAARVEAAGATTIAVTATAALPGDIAALDPENDAATDTDTVLPYGMFADGFEDPAIPLSVQGASRALSE